MKVLTTGQVAKICKVATRTVSKWFDSGRLKGYRVPGSQDRRIPEEYLVPFMRNHGIPLGALEYAHVAKTLVVTHDVTFISDLERALSKPVFKTMWAATMFETGLKFQDLQPDCAVVDFALGHEEAAAICRSLRRRSENLVVIAVLPENDPNGKATLPGTDDAFPRPFDAELLARRMLTLVGKRKDLSPLTSTKT